MLKFLGKLKVLKRNKKQFYLYNVKLKKDDFIKYNDLIAYNVDLQEDDIISFDTTYYGYKKIKNKNIEHQLSNKLKNRLFKNIISTILSLIALLFILIIFVINQFMIRKIEFHDIRFKNDLVYQYVLNNTTKLGPYYILDKSINNLSKELRQTFYEYAYVGLNKRGSKLLIEIVFQEIDNIDSDEHKLIGSFISGYDATIKTINITSGNVLVRVGDVIKKDQILVSSYIDDKEVPLTGNIIGCVKYYQSVDILKNDTVNKFTGNVYRYYNTNEYVNKENGYTKRKKIFSLFNFNLYKNIFYETIPVSVSRNSMEAIEYATFLLYQSFNLSITDEEEKIVSITNLNLKEKDDKYTINFFIVAYKNIVIFEK